MGIIIAGSTALTPVSALAASTVKGELNGFKCSGYVTIDTREASAVTSFSRGGDIRAYVTLYAKIFKESITFKAVKKADHAGNF